MDTFVLFAPEQTVALDDIVPATEAGLTVIAAVELKADAQAPLVTTAL